MISRDDGKELKTDDSGIEMFQHFLELSKTMINSQSSCWFTSKCKIIAEWSHQRRSAVAKTNEAWNYRNVTLQTPTLQF
jgi:hypothetical protein